MIYSAGLYPWSPHHAGTHTEGTELNMVPSTGMSWWCDKKKDAHLLNFLLQLVEVNGSPCLKVTEDEEKMTIPGTKMIYRLYDPAGELGHSCHGVAPLTCAPLLLHNPVPNIPWTRWPLTWHPRRSPLHGPHGSGGGAIAQRRAGAGDPCPGAAW